MNLAVAAFWHEMPRGFTFFEQKRMRLIKAIRLAAVLLVFCFGCTPDTTTDDELVGNWIKRSDFEGVGRSEAIAVTLGEKAYVGLGYDGVNRLTDFWEYDGQSDFWRKRTSFPGTPRSSAIGFAANGKLYVGLGYDGINYLRDMWEYDPSADTWKQVSNFIGSGRYDAIAFGIGENGYVCSGYDGNYLKDFYRYTPATDSWEQLVSPGGTKRSDAAVFVIDSKAYICTGTNNGAMVNELWMYDPATQTWTEKRKMTSVSDEDFDDDYTSIVRGNAVAFSMNGLGYITTGTTGAYTSTCWEYNPATDLWVEKTAFEGSAREGAIGFSLNNRGYVATGRSSGLRLDDLREFVSEMEYDEND